MISIKQLGNIGSTYRHLRRYEQIISVFLKYGFGDVVRAMRIERYVEMGMHILTQGRHDKLEELTRPQRLRMALEELGPTFVKFGQIISTRPDLIHIDYATELASLQDSVPAFPYEDVERIMVQELGALPQDIFADFCKTPIGAASIAQVHRATLKGGGDVVVKVRRPHIMDTVKVDLEIMLHLASIMENHLEEFNVQKPTIVVKEFAKSLEKELSLKNEAMQTELFRRQCEGSTEIKVPIVHRNLSTEHILTMEFIDGVKVTNVELLKSHGNDLPKVAAAGARSLIEQIFNHGYFHGDPHPGNILVMPDDRVCFIDFGMMGRITQREREDFADLIYRIIRKDERKLVQSMLKLTYFTHEPDKVELERDFFEIVQEHLYRPIKDLEVGRFLEALVQVLTKHKLRIKPNIFLMLKALVTIERVGHVLNPELEIISFAEPFIRKIQLSRFSPIKIAQEIMDPVVELIRSFEGLPGDIEAMVRQLKEGKLRIDFEAPGLRPMINTLDRMTNRLVAALVLSSLIIGSSVITHAQIPPIWNGVPLIGIFGFTIAGVLGLVLLWLIARKGRL